MTLSSTDAAALLDAARRGDDAAWTTLVHHFTGRVRSVARRHRLSAADQDDVAQLTWLALLDHIGTIRDPAALGGWLTTTARNQSLDLLRARRREIPCDGPLEDERADVERVSDIVEARERRTALHRSLDRLSRRQRRMARLMLVDPALSYDELSAALGMPRGSIGPTRLRIVERLSGDASLLRAIAA